MKKFSLLLVLSLFGCTDSEENASMNLRKGDEFFAKGEYEIAEYYYDKIPEESNLYKSVLRKKQEMEKINNDPVLKAKKAAKEESVTIVRHSHILRMGRLPVHTLTLANNTSKHLNIVEMDFVYLDASGKEVARLMTMLTPGLDAETEKEMTNISPGMVNEKFSQVRIEIKRTLFQ